MWLGNGTDANPDCCCRWRRRLEGAGGIAIDAEPHCCCCCWLWRRRLEGGGGIPTHADSDCRLCCCCLCMRRLDGRGGIASTDPVPSPVAVTGAADTPAEWPAARRWQIQEESCDGRSCSEDSSRGRSCSEASRGCNCSSGSTASRGAAEAAVKAGWLAQEPE